MLAQRDDSHFTVYKSRRCFLWDNTYYQMDTYKSPWEGLTLLETYTTLQPKELTLPPFLKIIKEVTKDPQYSMFTLSSKQTDETKSGNMINSKKLQNVSQNSYRKPINNNN